MKVTFYPHRFFSVSTEITHLLSLYLQSALQVGRKGYS